MGGDKKIGLGSILCLLGLLLVLDAAWAAGQPDILVGVTTGSGKITKENLSMAKEAAVTNALELAIQNAVIGLIPQHAVAGGLEYLYTRVLPNAGEYVVTYKVLGGVTQKDRYLVGVESQVNLERLKKVLTQAGLMGKSKDRPVILFLIAEKTPSDILPKYWWGKNPEPYASVSETAIIKALADSRFDIAGAGPERPDPGQYNIRFTSIYDETAAMDLARALQADMVVLGRAGATESSNRMGDEKTFDAVIDLSAYDIASGRNVFSSENRAAAKSGLDAEGSREAIAKAADLAGQDLIRKLETFWNQAGKQDTAIDVHIEGDQFLPRFIALKKRLREMPDLESMQPKEIGSDRAVMEMVYRGGAARFADQVMLITFEGFGIEIAEVDEVDAARVVIRFVGDKEPIPAEAAAPPAPVSAEGIQTENMTDTAE